MRGAIWGITGLVTTKRFLEIVTYLGDLVDHIETELAHNILVLLICVVGEEYTGE